MSGRCDTCGGTHRSGALGPVTAPRPESGGQQQAAAPEVDGYTLWALADDWLIEHADDELVTPEEVHDWLVAEGRKWGAR